MGGHDWVVMRSSQYYCKPIICMRSGKANLRVLLLDLQSRKVNFK